MSTKGKVLVAMSGGIDSTVTALMLHHQGYEVVGITMKTWDYTSSGGSKKETGCCNLDSFNLCSSAEKRKTGNRLCYYRHAEREYIVDRSAASECNHR